MRGDGEGKAKIELLVTQWQQLESSTQRCHASGSSLFPHFTVHRRELTKNNQTEELRIMLYPVFF